VLKKILSYIIIIVISIISGIIIGGRINTDIETRVLELTNITNSIRDNQQSINGKLESVGNSINGIRESVAVISGRINKSEERSARIENGINRLEKSNNDSIETIGKLIIGNTGTKDGIKEVKKLNNEFNGILKSIEERNTKIKE
jgi:peptidoglycan hydrolase CwlO-like protein